MNDEEKKECEHKWLPNGIVVRKYGSGEHEISVASCICEKCGEIKIKIED